MEQVLQTNALFAWHLTLSIRAASGLVVVSLKLLLVIDASDVVTCIDIAAIKTLKKTAECEVRLSAPLSPRLAAPVSPCRRRAVVASLHPRLFHERLFILWCWPGTGVL